MSPNRRKVLEGRAYHTVKSIKHHLYNVNQYQSSIDDTSYGISSEGSRGEDVFLALGYLSARMSTTRHRTTWTTRPLASHVSPGASSSCRALKVSFITPFLS